MLTSSADVAVFLDDLRALWARAGKPATYELHQRVLLGSPRSFSFLFREATTLPDFSDISLFLTALGEPPEIIGQWQERWECMKRADPPKAPPLDGPLRRALEAESPEEFVVALREAKELSRLSFTAIAEASNLRVPKSTGHWMLRPGNFPARAEQVRDFVLACGASHAEAQLWLVAYDRAQRLRRQRPDTGDRPRELERIGDELAARGRHADANSAYKEALAQQRRLMTYLT